MSSCVIPLVCFSAAQMQNPVPWVSMSIQKELAAALNASFRSLTPSLRPLSPHLTITPLQSSLK